MNLPPQTIEAAEDRRQDSPIARPDGEAPQQCFVCKRAIVDNHWFCRLPAGDGPILLCSPSCALRRFGQSGAKENDAEITAYS